MTHPVPAPRIPLAEITAYLLDPTHPAGASKAAFFRAFGFSVETRPVFEAALMKHPERNPIDEVRRDQWGVHTAFRCRFRTPKRRDPSIVSVWIVAPG